MVQRICSHHDEHILYPYVCHISRYDAASDWDPPEYAYFFFYSFVRTSYIRRLTARLPPGSKLGPLSTATELLLGAVAGALAQLFTIPVSVIATRQQVGRPDNEKKDGKDSETFLNVGREIIERDGVAGLWLGLKASLVLTVNPAITYGMFERVKSVISLASKSGNKLSPGQTFLVGALSKTLATVVCSSGSCLI